MDSDRNHRLPPRPPRQAPGKSRRRRSLAALAASASIVGMATVGALTLAVLAGSAARADDRSLLHATQQNPYVMIILDTSGSMHQEVACSAADVAAGFCRAERDPGACLQS